MSAEVKASAHKTPEDVRADYDALVAGGTTPDDAIVEVARAVFGAPGATSGQVSRHMAWAILSAGDLKARPQATMMAIGVLWDGHAAGIDGSAPWPMTVDDLATFTRQSVPVVRRHVVELLERGLISWTPHDGLRLSVPAGLTPGCVEWEAA